MTPVKTSPAEVSIAKPKSRTTTFRALFKSSKRSSTSKTLPPPYTPNRQSTPLPNPNPTLPLPISSISHTLHPPPHTLLHPPKNAATPLPEIAEDFGFFPLHPPLPETRAGQTYPVDIIALHGVNGHHKKTWTHFGEAGGADIFWLRDFLPRVFPGARIYTYGYNAKLILSRATGNINSFAETLLEEIMDVRTKREEQRRPIIFICHSMGGLVVKRALTIANLDFMRYGNIKSSTSAILFLATPHRGSEDAAFLANIATVSNLSLSTTGLSRFKGRMRDDLIKGLRRDDKVVTKIANDFVPLTDGGIKFYSFVEDLITVPLNKRVVDDLSGRMNVSCEVVIHLAGEDHRSIARYDAVTSPSYEKVLAKLKEAVYAATNPVIEITEEEDGPCLRTFTFPSMLHRKQEVTKSHPKTCAWILKHPSWKTWFNTAHGLLWIKGHPGTGKSTLMAYIHRYLLSQNTFSTIRLDFFFTGRGLPLQKSPLGMYRALLWQIYRQSSVAREMIFRVYQEKKRSFGGENWVWQTQELGELLTSVVREVAGKTEVMIFVDALDEAVSEHGKKAALELVEYFHSLNDLVESAGEGGGVKGVRICMSCRHYPVVGSLGPGLEIRVEDENARDLRHFINDSLRTGIQGWDQEPQNITNQLVETISKKAAGVFQWAVLRVPKIIRSINDGEVTFEELHQTIANDTNELFPLYKTIFTNDIPISMRSKSLQFLQWITLSERPLSLAELRFALACDEQERPFSQLCCEKEGGFIDSDSRMAKLTKSLSGGLAEVWVHESVARVHFIHGTVSDYLRSHGLEMLSPIYSEPCAGDIIGRSQNRLSRACLNYFRIEHVVDAIDAWLKWDEKIPVFVGYATRYLFVHASKAERSGVSQEKLTEILKPTSSILMNCRKASLKLKEPHPSIDSDSLIHFAAVANLQSVVQKLLESGVSTEESAFSKLTPLHLAAHCGHEEMSNLLLKHHADVNAKTWDLSTPLELAASNGHGKIARLLLDKGAMINDEGGRLGTPLQAAVKKGNILLTKLLISAGADVNAPHRTNDNALHIAATLPNGAIAKLLVENGADINAQRGQCASALQVAIAHQNHPLARFLLAKGADVNARGGRLHTALQAAALLPDGLELVRLLLGMNADVNSVGGEWGSALAAAARPHNEDMLQLLLDRGANVNARGGLYGSPLFSASRSGDVQLVKLMLRNGADIHSTGGLHGNILQNAVANGKAELVNYLLDLGIDVNIEGGAYGSVLQTAVVCSPHLVDVLLKRGAKVNSIGLEYGSPLYAAVSLRRENLVRVLLQKGADVNARVQEEHISTPFPRVLQRAARGGNVEVIKTLLNHGADINLIDGWEEFSYSEGSALLIAAYHGHGEVIRLLLDRGAQLDPYPGPYVPYEGAIAAAAFKGHKAVVDILLERGAGADPLDDSQSIINKVRGGQRTAPSHY